MANVNIKFNGKEFLLSCDDGQEDHLEELANQLSGKFEKLKLELGNIGESRLLLITSIKIIDEYFETKKKIDEKKDELRNLTEKFKELKSLVYQYRENKENEINTLKNNQEKLEKDLENNLNEYENLIDNTTNEIENFLKKNLSDNSVQ